MPSKPSSRSGGRILVDQLLLHGVDTAFCVPGESYLAVLDALYDSSGIRLINARHEAGAANMAEAYGKLSGKPGICLVTRGPGASHAAVGVHTASQDSTPMILLIGQVSRAAADREGFQEIDFRHMFGPVAKWSAQIERTERIPEYLARAFQCAVSGRPGPVVLSLPEDMLTEHAETADARAYKRAAPRLDARDLAAVEAALREAERPLLLVGGPDWDDAACADIVAFAEANGLPAACSFRRQDIFDNNSPAFVGDLGTSASPSLVRALQEVDLLLVVGARLGEITTQGYESLEAPVPRQRLVHVHASAEELGRVYAPDVAIVSEARAFARAVKDARWLPPGQWEGWRTRLRAAYEDASTPAAGNSRGVDGGAVMAQLQAALPPGAIVTLDAGNHTGWPQRFFRYARPGRQIGSTSGAMGYSVPAAVAASLVTDRVVIGCVGDGGFMMSGQEIATAVQHGGKPIILLFNNNMYGTIRMHQEREHPERVIGTDLVNPDFVALGKAHGVHAERVAETAQFLPALERALGSGRAALLELVMDPEQVSTRATITALRQRKRPAEKTDAEV